MSPTPTPAVVVFVSDVQRVSTFYRELASMQILVPDDSHCVLAIDGFQLTVHALRGKPEVKTDSQGEVRVLQDSYLKLCLPVPSIASARTVAETYGGAIKAPDSEWGRGVSGPAMATIPRVMSFRYVKALPVERQ